MTHISAELQKGMSHPDQNKSLKSAINLAFLWIKQAHLGCLHVSSLHACFQSALDFVCSLVLLLTTITVKDVQQTHNNGLLGDIECAIWNSRVFLWGTLLSSTYNLVCLTVER